MNVIEIWKEIEGYEGFYEISNLGQVRSLERFAQIRGGGFRKIKRGIKKASINNDGYYSLILSKNGVNKRHPVHRLLGKAFIANPDDKCCINHIDGNRQNNELSNLEWVTLQENAKHAFNTNLIDHESLRERGLKAAEKRKSITVQYSKNGDVIAIFESQKEASEKTKITKCLISLCCSGINKTAGGYVFKTLHKNNGSRSSI